MKKHIVFLAVFGVISIKANNMEINIINNTGLPLDVGFEMPSFSRSETKITSLRSQQELQDLLYKAILTNSTQEIMQAVRMGADVNGLIGAKAPITLAKELKKNHSFEALRMCGAVVTCSRDMLYMAILNDSGEDVMIAINSGASPNDENIIMGEKLYPLDLAICLSKSNAVEVLLKFGAIVACDGCGGVFKNKGGMIFAHALLTKDNSAILLLLQREGQLRELETFDRYVQCAISEMDFNIKPGVGNRKSPFILTEIESFLRHYTIDEDLRKSAEECIAGARLCNAWAGVRRLDKQPGAVKGMFADLKKKFELLLMRNN